MLNPNDFFLQFARIRNHYEGLHGVLVTTMLYTDISAVKKVTIHITKIE